MTRFDTDNLGTGRANASHRAVAASPSSQSALSGPSGLPSLSQVIDELFAIKTPDVEWLERAGPIAARLNEDSHKDIPE